MSATRERAGGGGDVERRAAMVPSVPSARGAIRLTPLEEALISRILDDPRLQAIRGHVNFGSVVVVERRSTAFGTVTKLGRSPELKLFDDATTLIWWKVGARLNDEGLETGYVLYVCDGYVTDVQGYTYGKRWPDIIHHFELREL